MGNYYRDHIPIISRMVKRPLSIEVESVFTLSTDCEDRDGLVHIDKSTFGIQMKVL